MTRRAHGEGSYDYNEELNRWRWRGYCTIGGERKRKEIVAKSRKELKAKVEFFLKELEDNNVDVYNNMTVARWCNTWLTDIIKPSVKTRTYETYKATCDSHIIPHFGNKKLKELQPIDLQKFFNSLLNKYAADTVSRFRRQFTTMLNAAIEYGYVKTNPVKRTKPPKSEKREIISLSEEESLRLLEVAAEGQYIYHGCKQLWEENEGMAYLRHCYHAVVVLALTSGMRQGEIFGLRWHNVDLPGKTVRVADNMVTSAEQGEFIDTPKTATSKRNILLPQKTINTLQNWKNYQTQYAEKWGDIYKNDQNLVFSNSYGNLVSITNFTRRYFRKMCQASGISDDFSFHGLRHTSATLLLRQGVNVKVVSERLGHSKTSITMDRYAHALPDMQQAAVDQLEKLYPGAADEPDTSTPEPEAPDDL